MRKAGKPLLALLLSSATGLAAAGAADVVSRFPCGGLVQPADPGGAASRPMAECLESIDTERLKGALRESAFAETEPNEQTHIYASAVFQNLLSRRVTVASDWRAYLRIAAMTWNFQALSSLNPFDTQGIWTAEFGEATTVQALMGPPGVKSLWQIDANQRKLTEITFTSHENDFLLVVFSPMCNPCRRAARDILADQQLNQIFRSCAVWVSQVDQNFSFKQYRDWNNMHPTLTSFLVKNWQAFDLQSPRLTPSFYAFKNGRPIKRIDGWPATGAKAQFLAAMGQPWTSMACANGALR